MSSSEQIEAALELLRAEYLDTPTLLLTPGDVAELLDLDRATAVTALQALESSGADDKQLTTQASTSSYRSHAYASRRQAATRNTPPIYDGRCD